MLLLKSGSMKKNDEIILGIFIVVIILIGCIGIYYYSSNKKGEDKVDRKVKLIFDKYTYNDVYEKGKEIFLEGINIFRDKNTITYDVDDFNKLRHYAILDYTNYLKITNFFVVDNVFSKNEVKKFMELNNIVEVENSYYIKSRITGVDSNYIGSMVEIDSYDDKLVNFKSTNYYCDNEEFKGILTDSPSCDYKKEESKFSIVLENNTLRLNNLEEIKNILIQ